MERKDDVKEGKWEGRKEGRIGLRFEALAEAQPFPLPTHQHYVLNRRARRYYIAVTIPKRTDGKSFDAPLQRFTDAGSSKRTRPNTLLRSYEDPGKDRNSVDFDIINRHYREQRWRTVRSDLSETE